jgi:hypothetical protein
MDPALLCHVRRQNRLAQHERTGAHALYCNTARLGRCWLFSLRASERLGTRVAVVNRLSTGGQPHEPVGNTTRETMTTHELIRP